MKTEQHYRMLMTAAITNIDTADPFALSYISAPELASEN